MQQKQGYRPTLSLSKDKQRPQFDYNKRKPGAQRALSHDKDIKRLKENGTLVEIVMLSGAYFSGTIVDSDKYTIKMRFGDAERTFFKHGLASFREVTSQ